MKPYYEHAGITIYHGDCRDVLSVLNNFDGIFTDPPYVGLTGGHVRNFSGGVAGISNPSTTVGDLWEANFGWIAEAWKKTRSGMVVFCGHTDVCGLRLAMPEEAKSVALFTWYKRNTAPTGKNVVRFTSEFAWGISKAPGLHWDQLKTTVFDIPNANAGCMATERFVDSTGRSEHPTQKPEALMNELLMIALGKTICDPFMGTGTTLAAAKSLGITATGIEREERYCEIAAKRLAQEVLF